MRPTPCLLTKAAMTRNRLGDETSPYLRQHADNPVHWQPWGDEALARARREDKPILLSIGYAACHWCHVMAHESFEDAETAALMNAEFVSIKVDREERPDLDMLYQNTLALLGQHGGWPLTMFLTPDARPFWGGTYFPLAPRHGLPGFRQVLTRVASIYHDDPEAVRRNVAVLSAALDDLAAMPPGDGISLAVTDRIAEQMLTHIDRVHGGIGAAPKFPQPTLLECLWRAWKRTGTGAFRDAVTLTLDRMCQGGIYDHLGGGFARYATDAAWLVPHFEKMLYDNALMIDLLTLVWRDRRTPLYEARVRETIDWLLRDMALPEGGFAGTLDADSEGEEGRYYVWAAAEVDAFLGDAAPAFRRAYDVTGSGNWDGKTILNRSRDPRLGDVAAEAALAASRATLLAARSTRPRPARDDKVLADWNGLAIAALATAGAIFDIAPARAAARAAFAFVREHMTVDGRLRHSWCAGRADHPATLDDYAALARAALALHATTGENDYVAQAQDWLAIVDRHYRDPDGGGYFLSADDVTDVITRPRAAVDAAVPAGSSLLAGVNARLYYLTGESSYRERAEAIVAASSGALERNALALSSLLNANEMLQRVIQLVVVGHHGAADTEALLAVARNAAAPDLVLQRVAPEETLPVAHPAHGKALDGSRAAAYLCRGTTCSLPLTDPEALAAALAEG